MPLLLVKPVTSDQKELKRWNNTAKDNKTCMDCHNFLNPSNCSWFAAVRARRRIKPSIHVHHASNSAVALHQLDSPHSCPTEKVAARC